LPGYRFHKIAQYLEVMAVAELTNKQRMFVAEYLKDLNATQAAIRAGYSSKNADKIGFQLLEKTRVQQAIEQAMKRRIKRVEFDQDTVVQQLARIAFVDMKDVAEFGPDGVKARDCEEVDGTLLSEVSETKTKDGGTIKVKLSDRMKALELLGRHMGMFRDKVELSGADGGPIGIRVNGMSDDELRALVEGKEADKSRV
jgi:phage terminase small subunit